MRATAWVKGAVMKGTKCVVYLVALYVGRLMERLRRVSLLMQILKTDASRLGRRWIF